MFTYNKNNVSVNCDDTTLTVSTGMTERSYTCHAMNYLKTEDNHGLSCPFTEIAFGTTVLQVIPGIGIYEKSCDKQTFVLDSKHLKVRTVRFVDRTDINDDLVIDQDRTAYFKINEIFSANVYIVCDYLRKRSLVIVTDAPSYSSTTLTVRGGAAYYEGMGYGTFYGFCEMGNEEDFVKSYYRAYYKGDRSRETFIMSNTWGDRSMGDKLGHEFIKREIECAAKLGVDIVQIDDGWQKGTTYDASITVEALLNFKVFSDEFWQLNTDKFPHGIKPLADYALENGVRLGIWFVPETYTASAKRERDLAINEFFYKDWDVRYVKLDGVIIAASNGATLKEAEDNYTEYLDKLSLIGGGDLAFNLDITASDRFGYFMGKQYGTLFVENRYTDWGNYYPHNTLRNLWQLSKWIPTDKFQFEVLNNARNAEKYPNDPLAPQLYDIDYTFASVMVANPLIWMEMQNLSPEQTERLAEIIKVYKSVRTDFFDADIHPIGGAPDGTSWTGFHIKGKNEYILAIRELNDNPEYHYAINGDDKWELLASNCEASAMSIGWGTVCKLSKERGYALFKKIDS